ncbi:MAG: MBL fold metallo-hydrolase [Clostridia bacterium]|nr:MBL fold metallo-hydrolase [Clostridia bacterium]
MAKSQKRKYKLIATIVFSVIFIALCVLYYIYSPYLNNAKGEIETDFPIVFDATAENDLEVHFISVGQGDSVLIRTPDNTNILIDAGDGYKDNRDHLLSYLDNLGIKTLDYVVATHSDNDHIGGFDDIFDNYKVEFVFRPYIYSRHEVSEDLDEAFNPQTAAYKCTTKVYAEFLVDVYEEKSDWAFFDADTDIIINYGDENSQNKLYFDVLAPFVDLKDLDYNDPNSYSPFIRLEYMGVSFMFTGDADTEVEASVLARYTPNELNSTVLKLGHHGSDTSSSVAFFNAVRPSYSVVSCGADNDYGHPKQSVLQTVLFYGSSLYRTDLQGDIVFSVTADGQLSPPTCSIEYTGSDLYVGH